MDKAPEEHDLKQLLISRFPDYRRSINNAWRERDPDQLQRELHQLKGAALLFGFEPLAGVCRNLEAALIQCGPADFDSLESKLAQLLDALCPAPARKD